MAADIKSLRDGGRQWKPIQAFVHHVFNVMTGDANEMVVGRKVSVESRSIVPVVDLLHQPSPSQRAQCVIDGVL
jgi:hypothetical protein